MEIEAVRDAGATIGESPIWASAETALHRIDASDATGVGRPALVPDDPTNRPRSRPQPAPGGPGTSPTWASSAKDMVTTALGANHVWVTIGHGIINEVYWPTTGQPQTRDLGFIVAGPSAWFELKRIQKYRIVPPEPFLPLPNIVHEGEGYRLELEITPDPLRDTVLISFRLFGDGVKLYVLLAPHLGDSGTHNNASAGEEMTAWRGPNALCLTSDCGFSRTSAGYVGVSDGWQDFTRNGRMTWDHDTAEDGNVALTGELSCCEGTLALGLAATVEGAGVLARSSLSDGYAAIRQRFVDQWQHWARDLVIPAAPAEVQREAYVSAFMLKVHEDRTYPGAIVASLSVPWGNTTDSSGGYHLVWTRDGVEAGLALLAIGKADDARHMLSYLLATQRADGGWSQNYFPDGRPFGSSVQLDEAGFPIILAAKLLEEGGLRELGGVSAMVRRAVRYLAQNGPFSPEGRWEEPADGADAFTLAVTITALVAASTFLDKDDAAYALSLADCWSDRIEEWIYVEGGSLAEAAGAAGYYVRTGPPPAQGGLQGRISLPNRNGESVPVAALVGLEFIYLVRLGLRDARDPRIQDTLKVVDALLKVETPSGASYHRYNQDGYGEHQDGSPYDGNGIGRAWPLLTGERGHLDVGLGLDPLQYLQAMARMAGPGGLIPEQIWDSAAIPSRGLAPGRPSGSAMPLVWAHAEFLKLLAARASGRPVEMIGTVERRYRAKLPGTGSWHWRDSAPFGRLPATRGLVIERATPFRLHFGFDGWRDIRDRPSRPAGLGMHSVEFDPADMVGHRLLNFTYYLPESSTWLGIDHEIIFDATAG
jgi:glucoamylase